MGQIDLPSRNWEQRRRRLYVKTGKRFFDTILAISLLPLIAGIIAVLWIVVRCDGGPGFFGQMRIGRDGRAFRCWKIRTMAVDAEAQLASYLAQNPQARDEWRLKRKLSNDPRITPVGHFLRRTSLDELPQIWNVLRGDMSFVGPRPITADELVHYGDLRKIYLRYKPGVTGVWQVLGRRNGCYGQRVQMDCKYHSKICFLLDLHLVLRTAVVVFKPTGS